MRKLFVRRWVTIAVMAAGLVGLTATSASADVWYYTPPPVDGTTFVVGQDVPTVLGGPTLFPTPGTPPGATTTAPAFTATTPTRSAGVTERVTTSRTRPPRTQRSTGISRPTRPTGRPARSTPTSPPSMPGTSTPATTFTPPTSTTYPGSGWAGPVPPWTNMTTAVGPTSAVSTSLLTPLISTSNSTATRTHLATTQELETSPCTAHENDLIQPTR